MSPKRRAQATVTTREERVQALYEQLLERADLKYRQLKGTDDPSVRIYSGQVKAFLWVLAQELEEVRAAERHRAANDHFTRRATGRPL